MQEMPKIENVSMSKSKKRHCQLANLFKLEREVLQNLLAGLDAEVIHTGSSSSQHCLTRMDLDIHIRVKSEFFEEAFRRLDDFSIIKPQYTEPGVSAAFKRRSQGIHVDYNLTAKGSDKDNRYLVVTELIKKPEIAAEYNGLKRKFKNGDPIEYSKAKAAFWDKAVSDYFGKK